MAVALHCNFSNLRPGRTLGVAHYNQRLFEALARRGGFTPTFYVEDDWVAEFAPFTALGGRFAPRSQAGGEVEGIEYLASHFHDRFFAAPFLVTAFDLHLYDVPWKYGPKGVRILGGRFAENMGDASAVLTMFPRTAVELGRRFPTAAGRVFRVDSPTMLDLSPVTEEERREVMTKFALTGDRPALLYPSQLQAHKNHWNLLEAVARLKADGMPVRLICPGSDFDPAITRTIHARCDELRLGNDVVFPGFVSDREMRVLLDCADAVVAPSFAEGGANLLQEAIHAGGIGCGANLESASRHLETMGAAVPLFDPFEPAEIAAAIRHTLTHRDELIAKNAAARERIAGWNWDAVAARYADVTNWIATGSRPADRPPTGGESGVSSFVPARANEPEPEPEPERSADEAWQLDEARLAATLGAPSVRIPDEAVDVLTALRAVLENSALTGAIVCRFEDARTMVRGCDHRKLVSLLAAHGFRVFLSEWHPWRANAAHQRWRGIRPAELGLRDGNAWGRLLAVNVEISPERVSTAARELAFQPRFRRLAALGYRLRRRLKKS